MSRIVVIALGRILNAVSAVIAVRLYTELLKPEQVGRLALLMALISLFTLILVAPVNSYLMRKAIEWHAEGTLAHQLTRPLQYAFLCSALVIVVSAVLIRVGVLSAPIFVAPLVGLAVLASGLNSAGVQIFNYLGRPFRYVALSCATSWGGVALAGAICLKFLATAEYWLAATTAAQLFIGFVSILLIRIMPRPADLCLAGATAGRKGFDLRAIGLYSAPLLVATGLAWVQSDGYRYFFVHLSNERTLGLFAAGIAVGISPMLLLERMLNDTYLPLLTRAMTLKSRGNWPESWDAYASACILPLVLFTMLACSGTSLFANLLISRTYYAVAWLGALGAAAKCLQMISSMYVGFSYAALETTHLVGPYLVGALVTVGSIFLLAPIPPFIRFGTSLIVGAMANLIAIAWAARKRYHLGFPFRALVRAAALGLPIVGLNYAVSFLFSSPTAVSATIVLGFDTLYMAVVCWVFRPKEMDTPPASEPRETASEQTVQA